MQASLAVQIFNCFIILHIKKKEKEKRKQNKIKIHHQTNQPINQLNPKPQVMQRQRLTTSHPQSPRKATLGKTTLPSTQP